MNWIVHFLILQTFIKSLNSKLFWFSLQQKKIVIRIKYFSEISQINFLTRLHLKVSNNSFKNFFTQNYDYLCFVRCQPFIIYVSTMRNCVPVGEDKCKLSHIKFRLFIIFRLFNLYTCYPLLLFPMKLKSISISKLNAFSFSKNVRVEWIMDKVNCEFCELFFAMPALDIDFQIQKHNSIIEK